MTIAIAPIGHVRGGRTEPTDDHWAEVEAEIVLDPGILDPEATRGLETFSHAVVVFWFDRLDLSRIQRGARHPRGNPAWPKVGILAQRGSPRPSRIGVTTCQVLAADGLVIRVRGLDAIDGTPVLDVKPHMSAFDPRGVIREPDWANELMAAYW